MKQAKPKLSIMVVTYNQEQYISECLDSILAQEINFSYEIIVGDDCSTDTTGQILDTYAAKHSCISVKHHPKNLGHVKNWEYCLNQCQGEYIAILEGDDYWTDMHKLQRQADYLDKHAEVALAITNIGIKWERLDANQQPIRHFTFESMGSFLRKKEEVCGVGWYILSSSSMLRNVFHDFHFPKEVFIADTYLFPYLLDVTNGLTYAFAEKMTAYRQHDHNISNQTNQNVMMRQVDQNRYYEHVFPWLSAGARKTRERYLEQLVFAAGPRLWKYRLEYIRLHPRKLLSKSFLKRLCKTMLHTLFHK